MKNFVLADRDGTLIEERNYLSDPEQVELIPGVAEAIRTLDIAGWEVVCISNQSGVGRGYFSEEEVFRVNQRVQDLLNPHGVRIREFFFCSDAPGVVSTHRKPAPGMAVDAARQFSFDLRNSVVVGDKGCDVELAKNIGAVSVLVRTGYGSTVEAEASSNPDFIIDSFADLPAIIEQIGGRDA